MKRYTFEAVIQRSTGWGAFVLFPHDTEKEFHVGGRVPVQAQFGGLPYTGSLMPSRTGYHRLSVPRSICERLDKAPGDRIKVELWKDDTPRTVEMPADFEMLLRKERLLLQFEALSVTRRKEYRNWILSAKRPATRSRRLSRSIEILKTESKSRSILPRHTQKPR